MFLTQENTSIKTIETIQELIKNNATDTRMSIVTGTFDDIRESNQTFFSILLAVLAAWVGAVVAFYFGSENLAQAQQTLRETLTAKQQLSKKTIEDLLGEITGANHVITVKMNDKIKDVRKKLQDSSNVLVVDEDEKPLGVLYRWDLAEYASVDIFASDVDVDEKENELTDKKSGAAKKKTEYEKAKKEADKDPNNEELKTKAKDAKKAAEKETEEIKTAENELEELKKKMVEDDKKLEAVIELIKKEFITSKAWNKKEGIKNFAILEPTFNLLQAKEKMEKLATSEKMLLSVRGFVIDAEDSKAKSIINFANLTRGLF